MGNFIYISNFYLFKALKAPIHQTSIETYRKHLVYASISKFANGTRLDKRPITNDRGGCSPLSPLSRIFPHPLRLSPLLGPSRLIVSGFAGVPQVLPLIAGLIRERETSITQPICFGKQCGGFHSI